jgi:hypothetical protein
MTITDLDRQGRRRPALNVVVNLHLQVVGASIGPGWDTDDLRLASEAGFNLQAIWHPTLQEPRASGDTALGGQNGGVVDAISTIWKGLVYERERWWVGGSR